MSTMRDYDRVLSDFRGIFAGITGPQSSVTVEVEVHAETDRQHDQRVADELRAANFARANTSNKD